MSTGEPAPRGPAEPAGTRHEVSRAAVARPGDPGPDDSGERPRSPAAARATARATAAPSQLPRPRPLVDRDAERQAMDAARDSGVIVLSGAPGTGKTALAVSWAHGARQESLAGSCTRTCAGTRETSPPASSEVLGGFLRGLGVDTRHAPSPGSAAVITSRRRLGNLAARGARVIQVGPLPPEAGLDLLASIADGPVLAYGGAAQETADHAALREPAFRQSLNSRCAATASGPCRQKRVRRSVRGPAFRG